MADDEEPPRVLPFRQPKSYPMNEPDDDIVVLDRELARAHFELELKRLEWVDIHLIPGKTALAYFFWSHVVSIAAILLIFYLN